MYAYVYYLHIFGHTRTFTYIYARPSHFLPLSVLTSGFRALIPEPKDSTNLQLLESGSSVEFWNPGCPHWGVLQFWRDLEFRSSGVPDLQISDCPEQ